jgi:hypothetical protein
VVDRGNTNGVTVVAGDTENELETGHLQRNVVMGDDESTTVTDSVINRSSIRSKEGSSGARVDDSVVNRPEVATGREYDNPATDTQPVPDESATDTRPTLDNAPSTDDTSEPKTKFCIHCGMSIRADASVCLPCGESQPEA